MAVVHDAALRRQPEPRSQEPPGLVRVPTEMLDACRAASLLIGGPGLRRLGVTSTLRGEGRTSIALAMASIQHHDYNRSVAIVDMDFENPSLARKHDLNLWPGLAELARGEVGVHEALQTVGEGIYLVASGVVSDSVSRTVVDVVKANLLAVVEREVDVVIADLPPLLGGGPGYAASQAFDKLLLVVRAGVTPVTRVKEATADLRVPPDVLLNGTHSSLPRWVRRLVGR